MNPEFISPDTGFPEQCDEDVDDDGAADNTATCDIDCSFPRCGDGIFIDGQGDGDEIRNAALSLLLVYLY